MPELITSTASRGGSGMGSTSKLRQSISIARSRLPASDASWSMIPHGTPVATISASWHACASSSVGSEKCAASQSARATATSRAALDESPPPSGIGGGDRRLDARGLAAPLGERPHDPGGVASPGRIDGPWDRCFRPRQRRPRRRDRASEGRHVRPRAAGPGRRSRSRPPAEERTPRCSRCGRRSG